MRCGFSSSVVLIRGGSVRRGTRTEAVAARAALTAVPWPVLEASGNASCNARAGTFDQHPTAEVNKQRGPMKCESLVQV